jgi:hypothetical protein
MTENKFYMVWKNNGADSTKKHVDYISAKIEAERLAAKHCGQVFYVLCAETWITCPPPPITILSGDMK